MSSSLKISIRICVALYSFIFVSSEKITRLLSPPRPAPDSKASPESNSQNLLEKLPHFPIDRRIRARGSRGFADLSQKSMITTSYDTVKPVRQEKSSPAHRKRASLLIYSQLASMGYEVAQDNAAYILSKSLCPLSFEYEDLGLSKEQLKGLIPERNEWFRYTSNDSNEGIDQPEPGVEENIVKVTGEDDGLILSDQSKISCELRSLLLLSLSASQGNPDAYLRVGDMLYYGQAGIGEDKASAARYYMLAADLRNSHAIFNLGLMHEVTVKEK